MSPLPGTDSLSFFSSGESGKPDFSHETMLHSRGKMLVAGIDEAGRGPLAGPVVAAAVIFDPQAIPDGLDDSKKLSAKARNRLFDLIAKTAQISWCAVPANKIDEVNILQATFIAMSQAVAGLPVPPHACLIDGRDVPPALRSNSQALIGGDRRCVSIAAASIVAKVVRDAMMAKAGSAFPHYGFDQNSGYGTRFHMEALERHGPCPLHRRSYAPVAQACTRHGVK